MPQGADLRGIRRPLVRPGKTAPPPRRVVRHAFRDAVPGKSESAVAARRGSVTLLRLLGALRFGLGDALGLLRMARRGKRSVVRIESDRARGSKGVEAGAPNGLTDAAISSVQSASHQP